MQIFEDGPQRKCACCLFIAAIALAISGTSYAGNLQPDSLSQAGAIASLDGEVVQVFPNEKGGADNSFPLQSYFVGKFFLVRIKTDRIFFWLDNMPSQSMPSQWLSLQAPSNLLSQAAASEKRQWLHVRDLPKEICSAAKSYAVKLPAGTEVYVGQIAATPGARDAGKSLRTAIALPNLSLVSAAQVLYGVGIGKPSPVTDRDSTCSDYSTKPGTAPSSTVPGATKNAIAGILASSNTIDAAKSNAASHQGSPQDSFSQPFHASPGQSPFVRLPQGSDGRGGVIVHSNSSADRVTNIAASSTAAVRSDGGPGLASTLPARGIGRQVRPEPVVQQGGAPNGLVGRPSPNSGNSNFAKSTSTANTSGKKSGFTVSINYGNANLSGYQNTMRSTPGVSSSAPVRSAEPALPLPSSADSYPSGSSDRSSGIPYGSYVPVNTPSESATWITAGSNLAPAGGAESVPLRPSPPAPSVVPNMVIANDAIGYVKIDKNGNPVQITKDEADSLVRGGAILNPTAAQMNSFGAKSSNANSALDRTNDGRGGFAKMGGSSPGGTAGNAQVSVVAPSRGPGPLMAFPEDDRYHPWNENSDLVIRDNSGGDRRGTAPGRGADSKSGSGDITDSSKVLPTNTPATVLPKRNDADVSAGASGARSNFASNPSSSSIVTAPAAERVRDQAPARFTAKEDNPGLSSSKGAFFSTSSATTTSDTGRSTTSCVSAFNVTACADKNIRAEGDNLTMGFGASLQVGENFKARAGTSTSIMVDNTDSSTTATMSTTVGAAAQAKFGQNQLNVAAEQSASGQMTVTANSITSGARFGTRLDGGAGLAMGDTSINVSGGTAQSVGAGITVGENGIGVAAGEAGAKAAAISARSGPNASFAAGFSERAGEQGGIAYGAGGLDAAYNKTSADTRDASITSASGASASYAKNSDSRTDAYGMKTTTTSRDVSVNAPGLSFEQHSASKSTEPESDSPKVKANFEPNYLQGAKNDSIKGGEFGLGAEKSAEPIASKSFSDTGSDGLSKSSGANDAASTMLKQPSDDSVAGKSSGAKDSAAQAAGPTVREDGDRSSFASATGTQSAVAATSATTATSAVSNQDCDGLANKSSAAKDSPVDVSQPTVKDGGEISTSRGTESAATKASSPSGQDSATATKVSSVSDQEDPATAAKASSASGQDCAVPKQIADDRIGKTSSDKEATADASGSVKTGNDGDRNSSASANGRESDSKAYSAVGEDSTALKQGSDEPSASKDVRSTAQGGEDKDSTTSSSASKSDSETYSKNSADNIVLSENGSAPIPQQNANSIGTVLKQNVQLDDILNGQDTNDYSELDACEKQCIANMDHATDNFRQKFRDSGLQAEARVNSGQLLAMSDRITAAGEQTAQESQAILRKGFTTAAVMTAKAIAQQTGLGGGKYYVVTCELSRPEFPGKTWTLTDSFKNDAQYQQWARSNEANGYVVRKIKAVWSDRIVQGGSGPGVDRPL